MVGKSASHWPISITNGAAAVLNIFLPIALVRILSLDQMGRYKIFFLYVAVSPGLFLVSGLSNGIYHWAGKYPDGKLEIQQSWTWFMAACLAVAAFGLVLTPWIAPAIHFERIDLQVFLLATPFALASIFLEDLLIARGDIWAGSLYSAGFSVVRTLGIVLAAWWTHSVLAVVWVFLGAMIVRFIVGAVMLAPTGELKLMFSRPASKAVLAFAFPVALAALCGLALNSVDQMILSFRLVPSKFALYAMGCLAIPPLQILETSVNRVLIPRLSQAFSKMDLARGRELFSEAVSELYRFLLPAAVGLILYAKPIILILFKEQYLASVPYLRLYAVTYLLLSLPFDAVARARADGKWILRTSLFFAILAPVATWFAAGRWGPMGALLAVLTSTLSMRLYAQTYGRVCFQSSFSDFLPFRDMIQQTALVGIVTTISLLLHPLFAGPRLWFLVTGPLFAIVYLGGTYLLSLRQHLSSGEPIHVLELAQTLGLGGLERMVYSLAQALNQHERFRVLVVTYDEPPGAPSLAGQFQESGIPLVQWEKGLGFSVPTVLRLIRLIFAEDTRIVHVHDLGPLIYGSFAKIFSLGRVRLFVTLHTTLHWKQEGKDRRYYRIFLRFADRLIAVSPEVRAGLLELGVPEKRIELIPNGVTFAHTATPARDLREMRILRERLLKAVTPAEAGAQSDALDSLPAGRQAALRGDDSMALCGKRWILCLARLHPGKGQDVVLEVWRQIPVAVRASLALFFVGQETQPGTIAALQKTIEQMPDRDQIQVIGPSARPQDWLLAADLFISGSHHEGMPLAPLEAVGFGLPTLLSNIEGHQFLRPWAQFFDILKPSDAAQHIVEVMDSMRDTGESRFFENQWNETAPVRERWGAPVMAASYAQIFQSA